MEDNPFGHKWYLYQEDLNGSHIDQVTFNEALENYNITITEENEEDDQ